MKLSPIDTFAADVIVGKASALRDLLDSTPVLDATSSAGRTPLMVAASEGLCEFIIELINNAASVDAAGEQGLTALHEAASNGHTNAILTLIEMGASIDARTNDKATPLMCASAWGNVDAVRALVAAGADVTCTDARGATAYDIALEKGEDEVAALLDGGSGGTTIGSPSA